MLRPDMGRRMAEGAASLKRQRGRSTVAAERPAGARAAAWRWPKHRELLLDAPARAAFLRHLAWSMLTASAHGNDNLFERATLLRTPGSRSLNRRPRSTLRATSRGAVGRLCPLSQALRNVEK